MGRGSAIAAPAAMAAAMLKMHLTECIVILATLACFKPSVQTQSEAKFGFHSGQGGVGSWLQYVDT